MGLTRPELGLLPAGTATRPGGLEAVLDPLGEQAGLDYVDIDHGRFHRPQSMPA